MTTHLYDDYEPDYLTEARRFADDYRAWLMQLPAEKYNANIGEYQAELARREQAVDDALDRKYREQLEAAQKRNAAPKPSESDCPEYQAWADAENKYAHDKSIENRADVWRKWLAMRKATGQRINYAPVSNKNPTHY